MTKDDTTKDPPTKAAGIALLTKGLATQAEVARLAGVSRQAVRKWAIGIPIAKVRDSVLAELWRAELSRRRR